MRTGTGGGPGQVAARVARALAGSVTLRASGPVPAAVAWDRYDRPALWSGWAPHIVRVEGPDRLAVGAGGTVHGPLGVRVRFVVTAVDGARRRWAWRVHAGPLVLRLEHGVDAGRAGGSTTWLVLHGPLPVLVGYAPLAWWALHRLVTLPEVASQQG